MHRFINLFLILFLMDGSISLANELLKLSEFGSITGLRNVVAFIVILIAIPVYLLLGIDRRLPKRILLPLVLFVFWGALGMWPLANMVSYDNVVAAGAGLQVLAAGLALLYIRRLSGRNIWLTRELLTPPFFSLGNTLFFTTASIVLLPAALLFFGVYGTGSYLEKKTAGFLRLSMDGIYMTEKSYTAHGKTVRLAGMIHIADREYYHDLSSSLTPQKTIILLEGVSDHNHLLPNGLDHNRLANLAGLSSQQEMVFPGKQIKTGDIGVFLPEENQNPCVHIVRADVDTSDFDPQTIRFLTMIGEQVLGNESLAEGIKIYLLWASKNMTADMMRTIEADILEKRNRKLVGFLQTALLTYDTIVIPWGAMHMIHFENWLSGQGFQVVGSIERCSIDFRSMGIVDLLKKTLALNGPASFHCSDRTRCSGAPAACGRYCFRLMFNS